MDNKDLETIAERHAGIVTPALFDLPALANVTRAQLVQVADALGLDPWAVAQVNVNADGIRAEVLHNGQVVWQFWPLDPRDL